MPAPTVAPGLEPPWWLQEAPPDPQRPALEGEAETDVAVVGGGFTGLWTALALRERDPSARVTLLEAAFCGAGPSGRNGGFMHGYWTDLADLRRLLGGERTARPRRARAPVLPALPPVFAR